MTSSFQAQLKTRPDIQGAFSSRLFLPGVTSTTKKSTKKFQICQTNVQADPNLSSRRGSVSSEPTDVSASHVRLVRHFSLSMFSLSLSDTGKGEPLSLSLCLQVKENHKWWYKPHITREDAINLLKTQNPGTFIVRDSNTFPDSFGLALKVPHFIENWSPYRQLRWPLHLRMVSREAMANRVRRSW